MPSEKEKMLSGDLYFASDPELDKERNRARNLFNQYNQTMDDERELRSKILKDLLGQAGEDLYIEPPFYCDYGYNISTGNNVFFNYNCIVLDVVKVEIGDNVLIAPSVQINTATHPLDWEKRAEMYEFGKPIRIGSNVWIGSGAIICPGVSIADRSVIGAGSIVTKDIPSDVLAFGNPCSVIRVLKEN